PLCQGDTTVNNPLRCNGYTFHQATYSDDSAAIQVRDLRSGAVAYSEAPQLQDQPGAPSPHLVVRNAAGDVVMDERLTMAPISQDTLAAIFPLPDSGKLYAVSGKLDLSDKSWKLNVVHAPRKDDPTDAPVQLALHPGETASADGYTFELADLFTNPYQVVQGIPGMERAALLQLARDNGGAEYLDVQNMGGQGGRFQLDSNQPQTVDQYEYTFQGRRE